MFSEDMDVFKIIDKLQYSVSCLNRGPVKEGGKE